MLSFKTILLAIAVIVCAVYVQAKPLLDGDVKFIHPEALPTTEMRLAQRAATEASQHISIKGDDNVGLATTSNTAHYATLDPRTTWAQAEKYCGIRGYRLCNFKEICTQGEGNEPLGANELPDKQVFVAINGPSSNPKNVYLALTASAGDGVCTRKLNPDFGTSTGFPPKELTKSLVACCSTEFLQKRGVAPGPVKTVRASNALAQKFFDRKFARSRRDRERKEREDKEAKEKAEREAAEKKRKEEEEARRKKEEEERKKKEEEERQLQWDQGCKYGNLWISGKQAQMNEHTWRAVRSQKVYNQGVIKLAIKIHSMNTHHMMIGWVEASQPCHSHSFYHHCYNGGRCWYTHGGSSLYPHGGGYGQRYFPGDTVGSVLDFNRGYITFFRNGNNLGVAYSGVHSPQYFVVSFHVQGHVEIVPFEWQYN